MGITTGLAKVFSPRTRSIPKTPATQAVPVGASRFIDPNLTKAGVAAGVTFGAGLPLALSDPKEVGKSFAKLQISLQDGFQQIKSSVEDVTRIPQIYFMEVEQAYKDEIQRQQELKNIEEFGDPRGEGIAVPPTIEEEAIKPVSLMFAEGGELDMQGDMMQPQMQPQMPMGEVSQMEMQEAQEGLIQILQVIETLIQQGLTEDEILALLAQYGITEAELEQAAQVLGVDMEQLLGGAQMEQPQMEVPQQPMMMSMGGALSNQDTKIINSALNVLNQEIKKYSQSGRLSNQNIAMGRSMPTPNESLRLSDMADARIDMVERQSGRLSDKDIAIAQSMLTPDNEPMFQSRSPEEQIFSLNNRIQNLMTSYDMLVRNKEFDRAQEVVNQIDKVQQQIIAIQAQNVPQMNMGLGQKKN